jgi:hypothetical protein
MLYGRLPQLDGTSAPPPRGGRVSRRRFLALGLWFTAGSTAGLTAHGMLASRGSAAAVTPDAAPPAHGSLDWAWSMLHASDEELLQAAGDLERVSARHRGESELVPVFERLLDLALRTPGAEADSAAACAGRSLLRHGEGALMLERSFDIDARPELTETRRTIERVARRLGRAPASQRAGDGR